MKHLYNILKVSLGKNDVKLTFIFFTILSIFSFKTAEAQIGTASLFANVSPQYMIACKDSGAVSIDYLLGASDGDGFGFYFPGILTWSIMTPASHGTASGSFSHIYSSGVISPTGFTYTPATGFSGLDTFYVQVIDTYTNIDYTMIIVDVTVPPTIITGSSIVCLGGSITLHDSISGGTWSSSNSTVATVDATTGIVSGISNGADTISYTTGCGATATKIVTVHSTSGGIMGATYVCNGSTITLTDTVSGGTWSSGTPSVATVGSLSGIVTGVSIGSTTISYTIGCGPTSTYIVTVNPLPATPATIGGSATVCPGSITTLTDATTGGIWHSADTTKATVSSSGVVTGVSGGTVTISYTMINPCGSASATRTVTINTLPTVASISGPTSLCPSATITLTDSTSGGTWTTSNGSIATIITTGIVTGVAAGIDTIKYGVTNSCGTTNAIKIITVNPLPSGGYINGAGGVCAGGILTLTDAVGGGTWHSTNTSLATVSGGIVSGVSAGTDTISYTASTACGSATTVHAVVVGSAPIITTYAGTGSSGYTSDGIAAPSSELFYPYGIAVDGAGNLYIGDVHNNRIRKVSPTGIISTIAGTGTAGFSGDGGPATAANLNYTMCVAVDVSGNIYFSDVQNNRIRKINTSGIISTVVGNGTAGFSGDGFAATAAEVNNPVGLNFDGSGNLLIADYGNNRIRKVNTSGIITTIAGTGTAGYSGDGISATAATLNAPTGVATDALGNIYIAGNANNSIRKINSSGIISTVAGSSTSGFGGDGGAATAATLNTPTGIAVDASGNIYIADQSNSRIRKITSGIITTIAGTSITGYTGDGGVATAAELYYPTGVTSDINGNVYIADANNNAIRMVSPVCACSGTPAPGTINPSVAIGCSTYTSTLTLVGASTLPGITFQWKSSTDGSTFTNVSGATASTYIATVSTSIYYECVLTCTSGSSSATTPAVHLIEGLPSVSAISGPSVVCQSSSITLTDTTSGGVWSSTSSASVTTSGVVSGTTGGVAIVSYTTSNICGSVSATHDVTVNPLPTIATIIGSSFVCPSTSITLTDSTTGGSWASSSSGVATVSGTGVVTAVSVGSTTISYTVTNSCGTLTTAHAVTVFPIPAVSSISGPSSVCIGSNITLTDTTSGGTWISSNPIIATVTTGGVVNGSTAGVAVITYSVSDSCGTATATKSITVVPLPNAGTITGTPVVCAGSTIILSDSASGGVWSSSNIAVATVSSTTGLITGVSAGSAFIYYALTNSCGTATASTTLNVNPLPNAGSITGTLTLCPSTTTALSDISTGGIWSSSVSAIAAISMGGVVTGITAGSSTITYTVTNSCGSAYTTTVVTVNPNPYSGTISGADSLCEFSSTSFSDVVAGGIWSSSSTGVATISSGGSVTGVSAGVVTISYSVTNSCGTAVSTSTLTVNAIATTGIITGATSLCAGSTTTLTNTVTGGTWYSSVSTVASISSSGVVTASSAGVTTISYSITTSCGTAVSTRSFTVNPLPSAGTIIGSSAICNGSTVTLTDTASGGTWSNSNLSVDSISGGIVHAFAVGTAVISYTYSNICGTAIATLPITINPLPYAGSISGLDSLCASSMISLTDGASGGSWSSSVPTVASVSGTGSVTGISSGVTVITYSVTNSCGTDYTTHSVTVDPLPYAAAITGTNTLCNGTTYTFTDSVSGGVWSSSNPTVVTISGLGVVTPNTVGSATISYTYTNSCGSATTTQIVTVFAVPFAGYITGNDSLCAGSSITLSDIGGSGGTWSSSNLSAASVSLGVVSGVSAGTSIIRYTVSNVCGTAIASKIVTINPLPVVGSIVGSALICNGSSETLTDSVSGGIWHSSDTTILTVETTGVINAVSVGNATIAYSYTNSCGTAMSTLHITVNPLPNSGTIIGSNIVCAGSSITLADFASGGTWTSSNLSVAGISSGVVSGLVAGTSTIDYSVANICGLAVSSVIVTVNPLPVAGSISGTSVICDSVLTSLSDVATGGVWTSSNPSKVTVNSSGLAHGIGVGTATISYSVTNSCGTDIATFPMTVNPLPYAGVIVGSGSICLYTSTFLSDATTGGTWSASNSVCTVGGSGYTAGFAVGMDTISYTVTNSCGTAIATKVVTVNPLPGAGIISGPDTVCIGSTTTLSETVTGGSWSVSNATASISGNIITGVSAGIDTVIYSFSNVCGTVSTYYRVTINPYVSTISGPSTVCQGTSITLSDLAFGGTWTASNTNASVTGGLVTGVNYGTDTISYTVYSSCGIVSASLPITINPAPVSGVITGFNNVCVGNTITMSDTTAGGVWSISNINATVNSTGIVTGNYAGRDTVFYSYTNSCGTAVSQYPIVVFPLASAGSIYGSSVVCTGNTTTLVDPVSSGAWYITNASASIDGLGRVTGNYYGIDTVFYVYSNMCGTDTAWSVMHVHLSPNAGVISGVASVCQGSTITLTDSIAGGLWYSNTLASVTGGLVTGVSTGIDTILYVFTNSCGSDTAKHVVNINPLPNAGFIIGTSTICVGELATLTDLAAGGFWASTDSSATIVGGVVSALHAGIDTITYTSYNMCGIDIAKHPLTINPLPYADSITGLSVVCVGATITLTDTAHGGVWSASNNNVTVSAGNVSGVYVGLDTVSFTVTNSCGVASVSHYVTVNPLPYAGIISGNSTVCVNDSIILTDLIAGGIWQSTNLRATVLGGVVKGISYGKDTVIYSVTNFCGTATASKVITVNPLPNAGIITGQDSVCEGHSTTLTDLVPGGIWTASNGNATVSGGIILGLVAGYDTINYSVSNSCGTATAVSIVVVELSANASISGKTYACVGRTDTIYGSPYGGVWTTNNAIATLTDNLVGESITGVSAGIDTITYKFTNQCGITLSKVTVNVFPAEQCPDGVEQINAKQNQFIKIFPNPSDGNFFVELPADGKEYGLMVTDMYGNTVKELHGKYYQNNHLQIDLGKNAAGSYIIKTLVDGNMYYNKIVIW